MNMDPAMVRQSAAMMKNMSPEQLKAMGQAAEQMYKSGNLPPGMGGMGGMGGGFPAYAPPVQPVATASEK